MKLVSRSRDPVPALSLERLDAIAYRTFLECGDWDAARDTLDTLAGEAPGEIDAEWRRQGFARAHGRWRRQAADLARALDLVSRDDLVATLAQAALDALRHARDLEHVRLILLRFSIEQPEIGLTAADIAAAITVAAGWQEQDGDDFEPFPRVSGWR